MEDTADPDHPSSRLEMATRTARIAVWEWDFQKDTLYWSPVFFEILGISRAEFSGQASDFIDRLVPEDRERVQKAVENHVEHGTPYDLQYHMIHADGHRITLVATGQVRHDNEGNPYRMVGTVQDVSERMSLAEKLLRAERIGRIGHWELDIPENTLSWSPETFRIHGLDPDDAQPNVEEAFSFYHPEDVGRVSENFERVFETGELRGVNARLKLKNGDIRHVYADGIASDFDDDGRPIRIFGILHDRTEFVMKEEQLKRSQKLEAVGQLAGGIAHDFNNLLAVIHGNLELLLEDEETHTMPAEERIDTLTSAIAAARRGAELTRNVLAFASKSRLEPKCVVVNDLIEETGNWLSRMIPSTIKVQTDLRAEGVTCLLDPAGFQSALVNIVVNARDAMPEGGTLTIKSDRVAAAAPLPPELSSRSSSEAFLVVSVTDTGSGIAPNILDKVFEPFVSTKAPSTGTGLGLSMVQGFALQSGGAVTISSDEGIGTCVCMYFPELKSKLVRRDDKATAQSVQPQSTKKQRILVAEDQLEVLAVVSRVLKAAGYDVEPATSGDLAYELFQENGPFDLLLTDVVMPGDKSGPALAQACRGLAPDLPVVFMTGYASEHLVLGNRLRAEDIRLMKPVPKSELLGAIRQALSGSE